MAGSFLKENHKLITIFLCVLSIALILASQFVSIFILDAEKSIGGLATINLDAEFYQSGVDFTATAKVEAGGLGGMIGGIADLGSVGDDGNITISDHIYYYQGLDQFQGMIGVLFDTTKNADYTVNLQTWNFTNTWVWVNTHTDLIPWWPEGLGQDITITVRLNQTDNIKEVRINRVWIDIYTDWNETQRKYKQLAEKAWEISPDDVLTQEGDEKIYKHAVAIEKEWGDKIGIITMVDLTMIDVNDETDIVQVRPFTSISHPQKMVNIRPLTQGQFISILLMFISLPISILAIIFAVLGILFTNAQRKRRVHLLFTAGLLEIFAAIFFINGANTLLSLITFLTEDDYSWNILGIMIPILAGAILIVAFIIEMKYRVKEPEEVGLPEDEIKFDISEAMAEEAEEEEGFECPACGKEFTEMVSECPKCGAEFEGLEEDEVEEDEAEEEDKEVADDSEIEKDEAKKEENQDETEIKDNQAGNEVKTENGK
jgi:hypothetical protein